MKCFMCKGSMTNQLTSYMLDIDDCFIIIKNVPSQVCTQCGDVSYDHQTAVQLEKMVNDIRRSATEITVVRYTEQVA